MVIAIIIALIGLLFLLIVVINRESRTETSEQKTKPELKTLSMSGHGQPQSLDALYAEKNGLWVCSHCETLNQKSALRCVACGEEQ